MKKLRALPIAAVIAIVIGATAVAGGTAYVVYKTVIEPLTVEQTGSVTEDGKNKTTFAVAGCPSYDGVTQTEITAVTSVNSGVSSEEARNYVIARCEQNAITKYAHDMVAANGAERYDSSILSTWQPVTMPTSDSATIEADIGPRTITAETVFYKNGQLVERSAIPEGSLILIAYGGVATKADPNVYAVMAATVDAKYYDDYGSGVYQRVPCHNNPSESCFSGLPGYVFYEAISVHTGPVPAEEQHYSDAINEDRYMELGGVITYIDGNDFTFRTSMGRSVTFSMPEEDMKIERAPEQALPDVGTEIIVTTIGSDRDVISSKDLLSAYRPILSD